MIEISTIGSGMKYILTEYMFGVINVDTFLYKV